ncbi:hypothetical protein [Kitasatospora sp. P5_F3]
MDAELIVALAAAGIGLAGTALAAWQAAQARGAARGAVRQAEAAEQQLALARQQIELRDAELYEARGPEFTVTYAQIKDSYGPTPSEAMLDLRQTSGAALGQVSVTVLLQTQHRQPREVAYAVLGPTATGTDHLVNAPLELGYRDGATVILHLTCEEQGTQHTWERSVTYDLFRAAFNPRKAPRKDRYSGPMPDTTRTDSET